MQAGDPQRALALVRLHELVGASRELLERLARELEDYDPRVVSRASHFVATDARQRAIADAVSELVDVVETAFAQREVLLTGQSIDILPSALVDAAAEWLATSVADEREVRLAARLLPPAKGLIALADGLSGSESLTMTAATLRSVLGAFRNFPAEAIDTVASRADVHPDVQLNALGADALRRLIRALRFTAADLAPGADV